jgi:hypothetical protein
MIDALYAIMRRDPDGGEREPSNEDRERFRRWAIATYGPEVWDRYRRGGWEPRPDV